MYNFNRLSQLDLEALLSEGYNLETFGFEFGFGEVFSQNLKAINIQDIVFAAPAPVEPLSIASPASFELSSLLAANGGDGTAGFIICLLYTSDAADE